MHVFSKQTKYHNTYQIPNNYNKIAQSCKITRKYIGNIMESLYH